jgi:cobalt-zinc-cadmium efflux system outer membrane protein
MMRIALVIVLAVLTESPAFAQNDAGREPLTLQELEQLALQNNPATTAAAAAVDAARARTAQAGAWSNPTIGYSGAELTNGPDVRGQHGFFVEQTIPLGGKLRLSREVFQQTIAQVEAARDLQRLRTLGEVRQAYFAVLLVERRIEVQERMVKLAAESAGVTAQLFNVGAADRPDFLESEIASRRVQLQLAQSRNALRAERARLAAIVGSPEVVDRPLAAAGESPVPALERETVIRTLVEQSPEIRSARAELERTRAITGQARRVTFPDLFVRGGAGYNREHGEVSGRAIGWEGMVEAGVSVPLFNRNAGDIAAARSDETRAQAELRRVELSLRARAEAEFSRYISAMESAEAYRTDILPRAEEAYTLYLSRYREMAAAYPQVLMAQRNLFELSAEYLDHLRQAWQSAIRLQGSLTGDALDGLEVGSKD